MKAESTRNRPQTPYREALAMTESTWTSPVLEELSVPGGTFGGNPDADDAGADDGTVS